MKKILLISSSGGHFEQLQRLLPLGIDYQLVWCSERTKYDTDVRYLFPQTGSKDVLFPIKLFIIAVKSLFILIKEKPDVIISTGAMVAIPMFLIGKLFKKKLIFIETFARVKDGTRTGKFLYKYSDLFFIQWEDLKSIYPNATFEGGLY